MGTRFLFNSGLRSFDLAITSLNRLWKSHKKYQWIVGTSLIFFSILKTTFSAFLCDSKNCVHFRDIYRNFVFELRSPMCWKRCYFFADPWGKFSKPDAKILNDKHFSVSFLRSVLSWVKLSMTLYRLGWPEKYCSVFTHTCSVFDQESSS